MGAPNPMGIAECAPTIKEVLRDLRKGRGLPTCGLVDSSGSSNKGSYVTYHRARPTPECPAGFKQGSDGIVYHQGKRPERESRFSHFSGGATNLRYSDDSFLARYRQGEYARRVCVSGNDYGQVVTGGYSFRKDEDNPRVVNHFFEKVVIMKPDGADYEFIMHIDGKPYAKHRF